MALCKIEEYGTKALKSAKPLGLVMISVINFVIFGIFIFSYAKASYPLIGHDYRLFITRLLDTHLHYKVNGVSIQWYTPSFGAGLPAYGNPLQAQFSLPQLLTWFIDPLDAVLLSSIVYSIVGFIALFFFLRGALGISPLAAALGGFLLVMNGFFIERVVVGHVNFIAFPLISVLILAIVHPKLPPWVGGSLTALTLAIWVYSGGVYLGVIGLFSIILLLPMLYLLKPGLLSLGRLLKISIWGGLLTLLLCGSKLYATSLFMENFPREVLDEYYVGWLTGLGGLIFQLLGVMTIVPSLSLIGKSGMVFVARMAAWTGTPYGFWEVDASLSPAVVLLLLVGVWMVIRQKPSKDFSWKSFIAAVILSGGILLVTQFSMAKGSLFAYLHQFPVFASLHANTRFTASFILPLVILGILVFDWVSKFLRTNVKRFSFFIFFDALALISLWSYTLLPLDVQNRSADMDYLQQVYRSIQSGDRMPVRQIIPEMNDYEVFMAGASNTIVHYEPLFRDNNNAFHPEVHKGSVFDIEDGYYNMSNPTGYQFPEENGTRLYERFRVSQYEQMLEFLNRGQPNWKIPFPQLLLNWLAGFCLIGVLLALSMFISRWKKLCSLIKMRKYFSLLLR